MLAKLWDRFISAFLPRVIPLDPPSEGGSPVLLYTLRPSGDLGDASDDTFMSVDSPVPAVLRIETSLAESKEATPSQIDHIIVYGRGLIFAFDLAQSVPAYSNSVLAWGTPRQTVSIPAWPVVNDFLPQTRNTGPLTVDEHGNPWTLDSIYALLISSAITYNGGLFVSDALYITDMWVEVYGVPSEAIRERKFVGGIYDLTLGVTTYVANLTAGELRQVYEAAHRPTLSGSAMTLSLAKSSSRIPNATASDFLAALADARLTQP